MEELEAIVSKTPHLAIVDLSRKGITDINPLCPLLLSLPNLTQLNLSKNSISRLDANSLAPLETLEVLDIRNNAFNAQTVFPAIAAIPNLKHLYLDLPKYEDERRYVFSLPKLLTLNGNSLSLSGGSSNRDNISSTRNGNSGRTPVSTLSILSPSRSPAAKLDDTVPVPGSSTPAKVSTPGVSSNGNISATGTSSSDSSSTTDKEITMGPQDLEGVAIIFDTVRGLGTQPQPQVLTEKQRKARHEQLKLRTFETHVQTVMKDLRTKLQGQESSDTHWSRQAEILNSKFHLFDVCFQGLASHATLFQPGLGKALGAAHVALTKIHDGFYESYKQLLGVHQQTLRQQQAQAAAHESSHGELTMFHGQAITQLEWERKTYQEKEQDMQKLFKQQVESHKEEKDAMLSLVETLDAELEQLRTQNEVMRRRLEEHNISPLVFQTRDPRLRQEEYSVAGQHMQRPVEAVKYTSSKATSATSVTNSSNSKTLAPVPVVPTPSFPPAAAEAAGAVEHSMFLTTSQSLSQIHQEHHASKEKKGESMRLLSLKQLKDVIQEIYTSYESRQKETPDGCKETMLDHVYTYLNHKYGLKSLIVEFSNSIMASIKSHSADHRVAVFGCILRNEIDIEFRLLEGETHSVLRSALLQRLKTKYPVKAEAFFEEAISQLMAGNLQEDQWRDCIERIFPDVRDQLALESIVLSAARQYSLPCAKTTRRGGRKQVEDEPNNNTLIPTSQFIKLLLDYQFAQRQQFLSPLVLGFKQTDSSRSGLLDDTQFSQLILSLEPEITDEDIDKRLGEIDPLNLQKISFSDCVRGLYDILTRVYQSQYQQLSEAVHSTNNFGYTNTINLDDVTF
mmetsp:Transcript_22015/g.43766  ORF Transcript_22015/g.43766 Transcript_22015/m.43766 type:complete len:848 (+) Transcript_22015:20-2563(+)